MSRLLSVLAPVAILAIFALVTSQLQAGVASDFVVNQTGDQSDAAVDGTCDVDTGTTGDQCTLRAAIEESNASSADEEIEFNIAGSGVHTISPAGAGLPTITDTVTIKGETQTGYTTLPLIEINGAGANSTANGLDLAAGSAGSTVRALAINGFGGIGIQISAASSIEDNVIGLDADGTTAAGNGVGIDVDAVATIDGNVVSANSGNGIVLDNFSDGSVVLNNKVGVDSAGNSDRGNGTSGIFLRDAANSDVGRPGEGNVVSGNGKNGIEIIGASGGSTLQGNIIGLGTDGATAIGNTEMGVHINLAASNITIGGSSADGDGNVISGNGTSNNFVTSSGVRAEVNSSNIVIQGNFIGTDVTGTLARGNGGNGIILSDADGTVGGTGEGEGNVVSANGASGIHLLGNSTTTVEGNMVGTDVTGTADLGNVEHGVEIRFGNNSVVGGGAPGAPNTIAFNSGDGISTTLACCGAARFLRNSIFANDGLGIDLHNDGVTANDNNVQDGDTGSNGKQNFPVLTEVAVAPKSVTFDGSLDSKASTTYRIEFFLSFTCDPSGNGEGQRYLGGRNVTTDAGGLASLSVTLLRRIDAGRFITATATGPEGTSEFSACETSAAVSGSCDGQPATIIGTDENNKIVGSPNVDVILALGGDDTVSGRGSADVVCGETGEDSLRGGASGDSLFGGSGNDDFLGGPGSDTLRGGGDDDLLRGNPGSDDLFGEGGDDTLSGGDDQDDLSGGPDTDTCDGGSPPTTDTHDGTCETLTRVP